MGSACATLRDRRRSSKMMITTNGKPPTWLWFLFLVFGSSLGIWLQWKKHQAMCNAIDREIYEEATDSFLLDEFKRTVDLLV
ncbi:hypothetical protein [Floridanema aerugineum]|jgi:hypothetical protein|uniref:Uncharacterized protein n=1 Tax=Floridaenema aerugineum BLCC-F46 TaxID=3153654 RepID=A0ABV4WYV0_9CYAN